MSLENLAARKLIHAEPNNGQETNNLIRAARDRLQDASNTSLTFASRFDLAYNAAYGLALAALRTAGYRTSKRYLVFQCLSHTAEINQSEIRLLSNCHEKRNLAEYEGHFDVDEPLLEVLIEITAKLDSQLQGQHD